MSYHGNAILNIGGGKIRPIEFPETNILLYNRVHFLLNLDQMYFNPVDINDIINSHSISNTTSKMVLNSDIDVYTFLERYHLLFDCITMYRFLEHVPKVKLLYFIYLLSTSVKIGGYIDVIVPDYKKLAQRILNENVNDINFESEDIITTFELLNEPYCPHCSIWTVDRARYFFELEGRFKVLHIQENYKFDGRDIYLRFLVERIEK